MVYGKGAYAILQLVVLGVLARLVAPAEFGVMSAALVVIGLSAIASQLGVGPALVQRRELEQRHIDTGFATSVVLGIVLGGLVWLGAPAAAAFFRIGEVEPVLRALAWLFPLQGIATVAESLIKRELRFRWLANVDVISYALGYGAVAITYGLLGGLRGGGVWALVMGEIGHNLVRSALLLWRRPPRIHGRPERIAFRDLMYFGGGFTVARIANQLSLEGDNLVVGRFLGPEALGFYGRAYRLMSAPASGFATILDAVLFPAMARVQAEPQRLATAYRRALALIALVILPMSATFVVLAPEIVQVVLGSRWTAVVAPFQILALGMVFRTSARIADSLTRATGAVYRRAWRQVLYATLVIGGAWVGMHWGIAGVAWAVLLALIANFTLMTHLSLAEAKAPWSAVGRAHVPALLLTAVLCPVIWTVAAALRQANVPALAVLVVGGSVVLACALVLTRFVPAFLGRDGRWMLGTMRTFAQRATHRGSGAAGAPAMR
jgi:PST family polysaccharide transporter